MKRQIIGLAAIALLTSLCACQAAQEPLTLEEESEGAPAAIAAPAAQPEEPAPVLEEKDRVELNTRMMPEKQRLSERQSSYKVALPVEDPAAEPAEEEVDEDQDHAHPSQLHYQQPVQFKKPIPRPEDPEFMI